MLGRFRRSASAMALSRSGWKMSETPSFEDARVGCAAGLGYDVLDAQLFEVQNGEERGFEVLANANNDAIGLLQRDGSQLFFAGAVGDHGLRDAARDVLHFFGVVIDDHHVVAEAGQMAG